MQVNGEPRRTIWLNDNGWAVDIIDQTKLPHQFTIVTLTNVSEAAHAIRAMLVRGAPLIGAAASYGMALAAHRDPSDSGLAAAHEHLAGTRPTATNLRWALDRMRTTLGALPEKERRQAAYDMAAAVAEEDVEINSNIGRNGLPIIAAISEAKGGEPVNILTHCNAGWLATVDWGTATAPIYMAHDAGIPVHVWVDETRPRNQGAYLTAWELANHGVPHTVIVDNAGGHIMQHRLVDMCLVGTDRTTATGDVCNKIGTYLKALAARDNRVPFYVSLPSPTIDFSISDGVAQVPIEQRAPEEVTHIQGKLENGDIASVQLTPDDSPAANYAFDVTPAHMVTGLITERGVCEASRAAIAELFPERVQQSA
ncbi:MAG: S-methyl-5-thioribose-1-phosphate isomerase [Pseudomonadota bacterium]